MPEPLLPAPGILLVAPPVLDDANFRRTVVLICEHNEDGTFGLVLNRVLDLRLADVLEGFDYTDITLHFGGPVQQETLHYLHRRPDLLEDAHPVGEELWWGGDFELLQQHFAGGAASATDFRFFLGYAGWIAGQLEEELKQGDWLLTPASAGLIFDKVPDQIWRSALRQMGTPHDLLVNFPEDPTLN